jgi:hypothetical protein
LRLIETVRTRGWSEPTLRPRLKCPHRTIDRRCLRKLMQQAAAQPPPSSVLTSTLSLDHFFPSLHLAPSTLPGFYPHSEWAHCGPGACWGPISRPRSAVADGPGLSGCCHLWCDLKRTSRSLAVTRTRRWMSLPVRLEKNSSGRIKSGLSV